MSSTKNKGSKNKPGRPVNDVLAYTPGGRVRAARNRKKWLTTRLAKEMKMQQASISRIENNKQNPDMPTWIRLAQVLGDSFNRVDLEPYANGPAIIPLVALVAAGQPIDETIEDQSITVDRDFIKVFDDSCALRVRGESMLGEHIVEGDILVCQRTYNPINGSITAVDFRNGLGASVKFWNRKGNDVTLSSTRYPTKDDPVYPYSTAKLGKVYEVLGLIRSLKHSK